MEYLCVETQSSSKIILPRPRLSKCESRHPLDQLHAHVFLPSLASSCTPHVPVPNADFDGDRAHSVIDVMRRYKTTHVPSSERPKKMYSGSHSISSCQAASRCLSGLLGRSQVECAVTTRTRDREDRAIAHGQLAVCATRR